MGDKLGSVCPFTAGGNAAKATEGRVLPKDKAAARVVKRNNVFIRLDSLKRLKKMPSGVIICDFAYKLNKNIQLQGVFRNKCLRLVW
jgi:hypothetical protein